MNSIGNKSDRRIPIRQRLLHPSMLSVIDLAESSNSDPGRSGSLSPFNKMKSMYFDDSLYENEMHYKISKLLDGMPNEEHDELYIKCDSEEEFNNMLDKLYNIKKDSVRFYGVTNDPYVIIVEKDPREKYRKFNEEEFLVKEEEKK